MSGTNEARLELATIRGIACLALVAYHVVGPTSASGMHLPENSFWHLAMNSLDFLRMPMFSVLSGYLYARHRVTPDRLLGFFQKKAARLLLPLFFLTWVMFVVRVLAFHDQIAFPSALFFHYQHLWFLQALILIFVGIALWDAFARPTWVGLCIAGFASVMISRTFEVTDFMSLNGALYLLPFFALGMILRIEGGILKSGNLTLLAAAAVAIVMVMQQAASALGGAEITRTSVPATLCGAGGAYLMLAHCPKIRLFEGIGRYSYTIYLWHSIAASAVRHGLAASVHLPNAIEFALLVVVGVTVPIALHLAVERLPVLSVLVAGIRPTQRAKQRSGRELQGEGVLAQQFSAF